MDDYNQQLPLEDHAKPWHVSPFVKSELAFWLWL